MTSPFLAAQRATADAFNKSPGDWCAEIYQNTPQSVANASTTVALNFDTEVDDPHNMWVSGSPSRITVPFAATWDAQGVVSWSVNTTGVRRVWLRVNGATTVPGSAASVPAMATIGASVATKVCKIKLNAGDYIEVLAYQNSGGALSTLCVAPENSGFAAWLTHM